MNNVKFPGLGGLELAVSDIALKIGPFSIFGNEIGPISIYWYGIIIAAAFLTAVILALRQSEKFGIKQEDFIDLILFAAPVGIIGARLYYVIFSWESYRDDPLEIFRIWHGGLAIYGGIIAGLVTAYFFAKAKKINPLQLLDFGVPYIAIAQAIGRWGNFVNQEAFGTNTTLPWGMTSQRVQNELFRLQMEGQNVNPDLPVHPTFLYESLWNLVIFAVLIWYRKRRRANGEVVCLYMVLYGLGRFFIEGLRTDSLLLGNLRISQVLAALFVLVFSILLFRTIRKAGEAEITAEVGTSEYGAVLMSMKEEEAQQQAAEAEAETKEEMGQEEQDDIPQEEEAVTEHFDAEPQEKENKE